MEGPIPFARSHAFQIDLHPLPSPTLFGMVQIGILGTGFMAVQHLKAYARLPDARVVALCNPSGRNLDGNFAGIAGNVGDGAVPQLDMASVLAYRDPGELFADQRIDLIDICTPTKTHVAHCLGALASGKHVLVEKPIARTSLDARRIAKAAALAGERGRYLMPAMCIRFWPEYRWLKQAIVDGRYGRVLDARFRRVAQAPSWGHGHFLQGTESGGALFDLHIHDVDFAQYCFGRPQRITASGYSKVSGAIDHVLALYHYPGGPVVSLEGSWAMTDGFGFNMAFTVNFEHATVDFDSGRGNEALRLFIAGRPVEILQPPGTDGYVGEIGYFLAAIQSGIPPTIVTPIDAVSSLELCETEERSIREGVSIEVGTCAP